MHPHTLRYINFLFCIIFIATVFHCRGQSLKEDMHLYDRQSYLFRSSVFMFISLATVRNVEIGYPIVHRQDDDSISENICQSAPQKYELAQLMIYEDITRFLRYNDTVVGAWDADKDCYVEMHNPALPCVQYKLTSRTRDCDNDVRLILNPASDPFKKLLMLDELRTTSIQISTQLVQMQRLVFLFSDNMLSRLAGMSDQEEAKEKLQIYKAQMDQQYEIFMNQVIYHSQSLKIYFSTDLIAEKDTLLNMYRNIDVPEKHITDMESLLTSLGKLVDGISNRELYDSMTQSDFTAFANRVLREHDQLMALFDSRISGSHISEMSSVVPVEVVVMAKSYTYYLQILLLHVHAYESSKMAVRVRELQFCTQISLCDRNQYESIWSSIVAGESAVFHATQIKHRIAESRDMPRFRDMVKGPCFNIVDNLSLLPDGSTTKWPKVNTFDTYLATLVSQCRPSRHNPLYILDSSESLTWTTVAGPSNGRVIRSTPVQFDSKSETLTQYTLHGVTSYSLFTDSFDPSWIQDRAREIISGRNVPMPDRQNNEYACNPGRYGPRCEMCPTGNWCLDGYLYMCDNAPQPVGTVSAFSGYGGSSPNCSFRCIDERYYRIENTCTLAPIGEYYNSAEQILKCNPLFLDENLNSRFIPVSSGKIDQPESCLLAPRFILGLETSTRIDQTLFSGSFTISAKVQVTKDTWITENETVFGILDLPLSPNAISHLLPPLFSWSMVLQKRSEEVWASIEVQDYIGSTVSSEKWIRILAGQIYTLTMVYDSQLHLVTFAMGGQIIKSSFYSVITPSDNMQFGVDDGRSLLAIGGTFRERSDTVTRPSGFFPGAIHSLYVYDKTIPFEEFHKISTPVRDSCTSDEEWVMNRCTKRCEVNAERQGASDECLCQWDQYNDDGVCKWCKSVSDTTVGSRYPRKMPTDCTCLGRYLFNPSSSMCKLANPPFPQPSISFTYPVIYGDSSGSRLPVGAILTVEMPDNDPQIELRLFDLSTADIKLHFQLWRDGFSFEDRIFKSEDLPVEVTLEREGSYTVNAILTQTGRLPGVPFTKTFSVSQRTSRPVYFPSVTELMNPAFLRLASGLNRDKVEIVYGIQPSPGDWIPDQIYSENDPPLVIPPAYVKAYSHRVDTTELLPSEPIEILYEWSNLSAHIEDNLVPEKNNTGHTNSTEQMINPEPEIFAIILTGYFWCKSNAPLCIGTFSSSAIALCVFLLVGRISIAICCKIRRRKMKNKAQLLIMESSKVEEKDNMKTIPRERTTPRQEVSNSCVCGHAYSVAICLDCNMGQLCLICRGDHEGIQHYTVNMTMCNSCGVKMNSGGRELYRIKISGQTQFLCPTCTYERRIRPNRKTNRFRHVRPCLQCGQFEALPKDVQCIMCKNM